MIWLNAVTAEVGFFFYRVFDTDTKWANMGENLNQVT